uniref:alcohol dehydrogenase n=1 Tax=Fagus sylvatica TaxID=28930 RepID=A0A2N9HK68_FAGSY
MNKKAEKFDSLDYFVCFLQSSIVVVVMAAEGARIAGASRIIGVDLNPKRFDEAKKFGVIEFVNPKDHDKPVQEVLAEMTDGGVDRSIECTGSINAMISAFKCVHDGWGVAVLVGVPNKDDVFKTHPMNVFKGKALCTMDIHYKIGML